MAIHPTAIIDKKAHVPKDAQIGPYVVIEGEVLLGKRARVWQGATISGAYGTTQVGDDCEIHMGAIVGHMPQDLHYDSKLKSCLRIGARNIIREYATIHPSKLEGSSTILGDDNFIMAHAHVAHDCIVGNNVVICNGVLIAGHAIIEDKAFISGNCAIHQFSRIGSLAMIGGLARVNKDVPPYMVIEGDSMICGVNIVGLRRAGVDSASRLKIREAYKILYRSGLSVPHAVEELKKLSDSVYVKNIIDFIGESKRGICRGLRGIEEEEYDEKEHSFKS